MLQTGAKSANFGFGRMIKARRVLAATALGFSLGLLACHSPPSKQTASAAAERHDGGSADALTPGSPDAGRHPVPSAAEADAGCVLDIGGGRSGARTEVGPDGVLKILHLQPHCWFEADCIKERGRDTPGDAMVSIDCRGRHCACTFESQVPRRRTIKFSFDAEDPCDDARLKGLLLGRCVSEGRQRFMGRGDPDYRGRSR